MLSQRPQSEISLTHYDVRATEGSLEHVPKWGRVEDDPSRLALDLALPPSPLCYLALEVLALLALSFAQIRDAFSPRSSLSARKLVEANEATKRRSFTASELWGREAAPDEPLTPAPRLCRPRRCSDVREEASGRDGLVPMSNIVQDLINRITCDESSNIQQDEMKFALSPLPCSSPSAESRTCYFCSFFFFFF